jgi:hypothetical protein
MRYANWFALIWLAAGVVVTAWLWRTRRQALENAGRIFIEADAGPAPETPPAPAPGVSR